jgi:hypothetical protein
MYDKRWGRMLAVTAHGDARGWEMRLRTVHVVLVILLGSLLTGCFPGQRAELTAGVYVPVQSIGDSEGASAIEVLRVDRDNRTAWFMLGDGSQLIVSLAVVPRAEWPAGCPTNLYSTRMEVLEIETGTLTIGPTTLHAPVLVRNCPPTPQEIVLRGGGEIGGGGNACSGADTCIVFEMAPDALSLPSSMKGYELYSRYLDEHATWQYTLITGTNRAKSYTEIWTPESVVTKDDWVKLTVGGLDALRSVLDLLPEGEIVTWLDAGRLESSPPGGPSFPEPAVLREVERYCQRRDISLNDVE